MCMFEKHAVCVCFLKHAHTVGLKNMHYAHVHLKHAHAVGLKNMHPVHVFKKHAHQVGF